ncbi:hypothetical protein QUF74_07520 [Candidatus Halobeggiatoa sp. HSG11]|nr:hypothetical protein [Candidatus Halobeggiatoa sp. HSG11]
MTNLFALILMILMLTSCATDSEPSTKSSSNQCPTNITAKINSQPISVNAPNPFDGLSNPGMNIFDEKLNIGLITKEIGLFELFDFPIKNLNAGTYSGNQFSLNLLRQGKTCKHNKQNSKFIIKQYDTTTGNLDGCFFGKLNCGNEIIEINAYISGTVY